METKEEMIPSTIYQLVPERIKTIEDIKVFIETFFSTLCLDNKVNVAEVPIGKYYKRVEDMQVRVMPEDIPQTEGGKHIPLEEETVL